MAENKILVKLANLKQEIIDENINIPKSKKAYGYDYSPLDTILPIIEPLMIKHGMFYYHTTTCENGTILLNTRIYETDGGEGYITSSTPIDSTVKLAKMNEFMVIGSAMTYFRRYHLVVMLGLLTDEDTDAGAVVGGRSIESVDEKVDFVKKFNDLIKSGKTRKQIESMFNQYKKYFSDSELEQIKELIQKAYEN